jgi:hypothetical protein
MLEKLNKKSLLYLGIIIFASLLSLFLIWHFSKMPKIKESPLPKGEIEKEESISEVLERLTPKEVKPMTEEEKKETEKLLKKLTPKNPKPKTQKEIKEEEELLKKLTP